MFYVKMAYTKGGTSMTDCVPREWMPCGYNTPKGPHVIRSLQTKIIYK